MRKTITKYRGSLNELIEFLAAQKVIRLSQFGVSWFDKFRAFRKPGRHVKTMYVEGMVVKQFFKWCKSRGLITESPIAEYKLNKPPFIAKGGPDLPQVNAILAALPEPKRTMIAILAFTGMRAGELQRLTPEDIDLNANWIHVVSRPGLETKTLRVAKVSHSSPASVSAGSTAAAGAPVAVLHAAQSEISKRRP